MLRGLRRRLDRLWAAYQVEKRVRAQRPLEAMAKIFDAIRAGLRRAGIDPSTVPAMRWWDGCTLFNRPRPPPQPPRPADPAARLRQSLMAIVERQHEAPLDLDTASPLELFAAYCFRPDEPGISFAIPAAPA